MQYALPFWRVFFPQAHFFSIGKKSPQLKEFLNVNEFQAMQSVEN